MIKERRQLLAKNVSPRAGVIMRFYYLTNSVEMKFLYFFVLMNSRNPFWKQIFAI